MKHGAREMAQWLRKHAVQEEDLGLILNTNTVDHNHP